MSFYESLDVLVGAGVMAAAPAFGCPVPPGAVSAGSGLSRYLRDRGDGGRFGEILDRLAQEVWLSRDTHGIPVEVAEKHAMALVAILEQIRPKPEHIVAAISAPLEEKSATATTAAVDIVARAHQQDLFSKSGLIDHVVLFLLERLFVQLTTDSALLPTLQPLIAAFSASCSAVLGQPANSGGQLASRHHLAVGNTTVVPAPEQALRQEQLPAPAPAESSVQAGLSAIADRFGIGDAAMRRFVAILDAQALKPEARASRLEELAIWLHVTTTQLTKPSNDDPAIRRLKTEAAESLRNGDFERAMERLKGVRSALRGLRRRTQERLEDEIHQLKLQQIEEAAACARLAELAFARADYDAASDLFAEAADSVPTSEPLLRLNYALRQADTLYRKGDSSGDEVALSAAAEHYRRALSAALHYGNSELIVAARCALAETLSQMSRTFSGTSQLREAAETWRAALSLMDPAREPRRVAGVFAALGDALFRIAEREGEDEMVDEAAAAYTEAVNLLDSTATPLDWALASLGRGTCLLRIAERQASDRLWLDAASALVPALEVLEAEGLGDVGRHARDSLRSFHANWARLLARPDPLPKPEPKAELPTASLPRRTGMLH